MVKYPPYPNKPPMTKRMVMKQNRFWDMMHEIEMPLVFLTQRVLFSGKLAKFWLAAAKLASSKLLSFAPCFLYAIGKPDEAKRFATTLVCYALISSFGKKWVVRRRPGSYPEVYCRACVVSSSFPSRHSIGVTVIASFTPFKWPYIIFMVFDRIACGLHYLTDCLAGVLLGELSVFVARFIDNPNLLTVLLLVAFKVWNGGAKILGGCLPLIMAPHVSVSWMLFPLAFLQLLIMRKLEAANDKVNPMQRMLQELLATSTTLFVIVKADVLLALAREQWVNSQGNNSA